MTLLSVGVLGARGHVGVELLSLLGRHPGVRLAAVGSRALAGRRVADEIPGCGGDLAYRDLRPAEAAALDLDAWILALPNGEAAPFVAAIAARRPSTILIDLSADFRFDDGWQYGLVERNRERLRGARLIANPGCYATGMQLAIAPLLELLEGAPVVFGVSGYSGAGTTPSPRNDPDRLRDNLMPYALVGHLHEREATRHLGHPIAFMPHVAPFFRGITLTIALPLSAPISVGELRARAAEAWRGERLISVTDEVPLVRDAVGKHGVTIGGFAVADDGRRAVVVATLDNLRKGAATQALQNLNLAAGLDELWGIFE